MTKLELQAKVRKLERQIKKLTEQRDKAHEKGYEEGAAMVRGYAAYEAGG
jgi:hypothetical protein